MQQDELSRWMREMVLKYIDITFKYEYSEYRKRFLISFSKKKKDSSFWKDLVKFNEDMDRQYSILERPLLCENEKIFKLSENAKIINYDNIQTENIQCIDTWTTKENSKVGRSICHEYKSREKSLI